MIDQPVPGVQYARATAQGTNTLDGAFGRVGFAQGHSVEFEQRVTAEHQRIDVVVEHGLSFCLCQHQHLLRCRRDLCFGEHGIFVDVTGAKFWFDAGRAQHSKSSR